MNRIRWYGPTLVLVLTILAVMVLGPFTVRKLAWAQDEASVQLAREELRNSDFLAKLSDSFRKVSDSVKHSVVSIEVLAREDHSRQDSLQEQLERRFFGPQGPNMEAPQEEDPYNQYNPPQERGAGSGWVFEHQPSGKKYIITNNHVVANADEIRVRFVNGARYEATVVGTDPRTDIAVLKINNDNLHAAAVANEPVQQGDIVFAFGSPFRFDFSVSQGIVSAKGRQLGIIGPGGYENFIQTDAAINPGNSGGPLTNIRGEVVGMNSAIASRTGAYNGLGFAIPVKMVRDVATQIIENPGHKVERGYLGIYIENLTPEMAKTFNYNGKGVLVVDPIPDSPADKAGIQAGDIVTEVNGQSVGDADDLRNLIAGFKPGVDVTLTVFRNGETAKHKITLAQLPGRDQVSSREPTPTPGSEQPDASHEGVQTLRKLGIESVETFTRDLASRTQIDYVPGVLIRQVRPGSIADTKGLTRGMIITNLLGKEVQNAEDLVKQVSQYKPGQAMRVRIAQWDPTSNQFRHRFILLELPKE